MKLTIFDGSNGSNRPNSRRSALPATLSSLPISSAQPRITSVAWKGRCWKPWELMKSGKMIKTKERMKKFGEKWFKNKTKKNQRNPQKQQSKRWKHQLKLNDQTLIQKQSKVWSSRKFNYKIICLQWFKPKNTVKNIISICLYPQSCIILLSSICLKPNF